MRLSLFKMTMVSLLGCLLALIGLVLYIPDAEDNLCRGAVVVYALGFYLVYSALASRIYGFIILKDATNKMKRAEVGFFRVAWLGAILFLIGIILTTVWAAVNWDASITIDWNDSTELDKYQYRQICHLTDDGRILLSLMLAYGLFLAISILLTHYVLSNRWMRQAKTDSQRFSLVSWMVIVAASIGLVITLALDNNQDTLEVILFLCAWLAISSIILCYYGPNVWILLRKGDLEDSAMFRTSSSTVTNSRLASSRSAGHSGSSTPRTTAERQGQSTVVRDEDI